MGVGPIYTIGHALWGVHMLCIVLLQRSAYFNFFKIATNQTLCKGAHNSYIVWQRVEKCCIAKKFTIFLQNTVTQHTQHCALVIIREHRYAFKSGAQGMASKGRGNPHTQKFVRSLLDRLNFLQCIASKI